MGTGILQGNRVLIAVEAMFIDYTGILLFDSSLELCGWNLVLIAKLERCIFRAPMPRSDIGGMVTGTLKLSGPGIGLLFQ